MRFAIATLGTLAMLTSFASIAHAQSGNLGSADYLYGLQERSIQTTSFASERTYPTNRYRTVDEQPVGIKIDKNLQLQVQPERETLPIGVYPADDNAKGNRLQLIYEFEEPAQFPLR